MINTHTGNICLMDTGFSIDSALTPRQLEQSIPNLIISYYQINVEYLHYYIWCDLEPNEYIYTHICFVGDKLLSVTLFPQHTTNTSDDRYIPNMDLEEARELLYRWCQRRLPLKQKEFPWGYICINAGSDPVYSPPNIQIHYNISG